MMDNWLCKGSTFKMHNLNITDNLFIMTEPTTEERPRGWLVLKHHLLNHKIDVALWATRLATMVFTLGYILPIMGNPYNSFYKVYCLYIFSQVSSLTPPCRLSWRMRPPQHYGCTSDCPRSSLTDSS